MFIFEHNAFLFEPFSLFIGSADRGFVEGSIRSNDAPAGIIGGDVFFHRTAHGTGSPGTSHEFRKLTITNHISFGDVFQRGEQFFLKFREFGHILFQRESDSKECMRMFYSIMIKCTN